MCLVFGGLTLALHDPRFIKIKPTIIYVIFAVIAAGRLGPAQTIYQAYFPSANCTSRIKAGAC